jgi:hypothetical protein
MNTHYDPDDPDKCTWWEKEQMKGMSYEQQRDTLRHARLEKERIEKY